jgi:hypothetical protein
MDSFWGGAHTGGQLYYIQNIFAPVIIGFLIFSVENSRELRETLEIPDDHQVPVAFVVGYPDVKFRRLVARNPARVKWLGDRKPA